MKLDAGFRRHDEEKRGGGEIKVKVQSLRPLKTPMNVVIPAKAGIQSISDFNRLIFWTPASAGVTMRFSEKERRN
jgi:hypothetical protein